MRTDLVIGDQFGPVDIQDASKAPNPISLTVLLICYRRSLETKEYNHITATYYLLAERLLRKRADAQQASVGTSGPAADKEELSPLALSPRFDVGCI